MRHQKRLRKSERKKEKKRKERNMQRGTNIKNNQKPAAIAIRLHCSWAPFPSQLAPLPAHPASRCHFKQANRKNGKNEKQNEKSKEKKAKPAKEGKVRNYAQIFWIAAAAGDKQRPQANELHSQHPPYHPNPNSTCLQIKQNLNNNYGSARKCIWSH